MAANEQSLPTELFMDIDRSGPIPLYYQVATRIEEAIRSGRLPTGARIENEVALSERLGLSRPTVRRAIQDVVDKGLLVRRRGIGTQVVNGQVTREMEFTSLQEDLLRADRHPTTTLLLREVVEADATMAERLTIEQGSPVLHLRRLRGADGAPLALLENFLPGDFVDLPAEDLDQYGLYQVLRARGTTLRVARQRIGARRATTQESKLLDIERGGPVLTMDRTAFDNSGRAVEFGHHCYRPDLYSFEVTLVDK
ncbi:GntR family transcriptional regulator [Humibacter ginsenosidimutans]|uniref:GntR family transcriptional regulator n=1 Tax=Humibacter ginsenosidimutans TaxID=2599293 RepID=A0A5B8M5W3_9MICO|nr:GntR family transcriptional regulator [Humibacter ginsenosidimutans]QDZ16178.1 GntR family transcriptional regulator [Humibacter ginsenosidimutans]